MNKTKLEVIRINEDVIATSGICEHYSVASYGNGYNTNHIKITNYTGPGVFTVQPYLYVNNSHYYHEFMADSPGEFPTSWFLSVDSDGWYYFNGQTFVKCDNQSGDAHPYELRNSN